MASWDQSVVIVTSPLVLVSALFNSVPAIVHSPGATQTPSQGEHIGLQTPWLNSGYVEWLNPGSQAQISGPIQWPWSHPTEQ